MNRYTLNKLKIDGNSAGSFQISGTFNPRNTTEFVTAITRLYPLQAQTMENGDVLLRSVALNTGS